MENTYTLEQLEAMPAHEFTTAHVRALINATADSLDELDDWWYGGTRWELNIFGPAFCSELEHNQRLAVFYSLDTNEHGDLTYEHVLHRLVLEVSTQPQDIVDEIWQAIEDSARPYGGEVLWCESEDGAVIMKVVFTAPEVIA